MISPRGLLLIGVPVLGVGALAAALAFRSPSASPPKARPTPRATVAGPAAAPEERAEVAIPRKRETPTPAVTMPAARTLGEGIDQVRLRGTYQHYRSAVATGNRSLEDSLRPVLLKEREAAIRIAEQDVAAARTDPDREVALKALESLRR